MQKSNMKRILVVLITHSAYKDVCIDFINLFRKNWEDCPYDLVISSIGNEITFGYSQYEEIYNGVDCTLPTALYNVAKEKKYDYYISFLGDAFIYKTIINKDIETFIHSIITNQIEYCCLIPKIPYRFRGISYDEQVRKMSFNDTYCMCFVAFIASREFILTEFSGGISDLEFERKYLSNKNDYNGFYVNRGVLRNNIFNLIPGITGGKWNRRALHKIKRNNGEIELNGREKLPILREIVGKIGVSLHCVLSRKQRKIIKCILSKILKMRFVISE